MSSDVPLASVFSEKEQANVIGTAEEISDIICENLGIAKGGITIKLPPRAQRPPGQGVYTTHFKIDVKSEPDKCPCGKPAKFLCSRCEKGKYCSTECQRANWKSHKKLECSK